MANQKKEHPLKPIIMAMDDIMNAELLGIAADNNTSRNEIIRRFCEFGIKNLKKFGLVKNGNGYAF